MVFVSLYVCNLTDNYNVTSALVEHRLYTVFESWLIHGPGGCCRGLVADMWRRIYQVCKGKRCHEIFGINMNGNTCMSVAYEGAISILFGKLSGLLFS